MTYAFTKHEKGHGKASTDRNRLLQLVDRDLLKKILDSFKYWVLSKGISMISAKISLVRCLPPPVSRCMTWGLIRRRKTL